MSHSLLKVLMFKIGILSSDSRPIGVRCQQFQDTAHADPHTAYAGLPAALARLNRNPIKEIYRGHEVSLDHRCGAWVPKSPLNRSPYNRPLYRHAKIEFADFPPY